MLTIFHGDDILSSRKVFLENKVNSEILDGESITITDLAQMLSGGSLFEDTKTIAIEKLLTKRKKSLEKDAILDFLNKKQKEHDIILWEGKELTATTIKGFTKPSLRVFKLPQVLFGFVDSLSPGHGPRLVRLFHQSLLSTEPEVIFSMIVRQFRLLIAIKEGAQIEETKRMQGWQKSKLIKQSKNFTTSELIKQITDLRSIDLALKTGKSTTSLAHSIDFFLLEL